MPLAARVTPDTEDGSITRLQTLLATLAAAGLVGQLVHPTAICVCRTEVRLLKEADWLSNQQPEFETTFRVLGAER